MHTISRLSTLKTAADFAAVIPLLEDELRAAMGARDELNAQREQALFGEAGGLEKLRTRIASADTKVEELAVALDGARKREAEATKREATADLEARAADAREADKRLRAALKKWHRPASELAAVADEIHRLERTIKQTNRACLDAGRHDLAVPSYLNDLSGKRREIADRRRAKQGRPPTNPAQPIAAVTPIARLHLPYYFERPGGAATDPVLCPPEDSPYKDF